MSPAQITAQFINWEMYLEFFANFITFRQNIFDASIDEKL
jgi:hypothetical protein